MFLYEVHRNLLHYKALARKSLITNSMVIIIIIIIIIIRMYSTLFFCDNLVDFDEARLHEVTFNIRTYAWIFSRVSIASVDGKQHLNQVEFSALVGFSL